MRLLALGLVSFLLVAGSCRSQMPTYMPDSIHLGIDGVVYLHSAAQARVYRFSTVEMRYRAPLLLGPDSRFAAYGAAEHVFYVAYGDGDVTRIDLASGMAEEAFAVLSAAPPEGLTVLGSHVLAVTDSGFHALAPDGSLADEAGWSHTSSTAFVWNEAIGRVYQTKDESSPTDILWRAFDSQTGLFGAWGESPYHGDVPIRHPLRISPDGTRLLNGAGLLFDAETLEALDALTVDPADALWLNDGLITLSETPAGATWLDQWQADGMHFNRQLFPGRPLRVLASGAGFVVVTRVGQRPRFHLYVPSDDRDADGFTNPEDSFPHDGSASQDSDLDGRPDAWNPGRDADDSTTGLTLDAFPQDSACWLLEHGSAGVCDIASSIPDFDPEAVVVGTDGVVYLLAAGLERIHRWSLAEARYLNPIVIDGTPNSLAYSPQLHRLYLAYPSRALTAIDLATSLDERPFAATFKPAAVLGAADPHLVAAEPHWQDWHHVFAPDGTRTAVNTRPRTVNFRHSTWSAVHDRFYFSALFSPGDLAWAVIDPVTGAIGAQGDGDVRGDFGITPPICLSHDESRVLFGSGDVYDSLTLDVVESLPVDQVDAAWPAVDVLLTLRADAGGNSVLEHWGDDLAWINTAHLSGAPRRILPWSGGVWVMTLEEGRPRFAPYVATDDADGDEVPNSLDVFPLDPAASLDTDNDGHPDAWNPGAGPGDSTTGLVLDSFPHDSACWLPAHGTGGVCDVAALIPDFLPDQVEIGQDDIVYLLSLEQGRIHRWSPDTGAYLNPIVLGPAAVTVAYAPALGRIFVGYADGRIEWIDPQAPAVAWPFAVLHNGMGWLTSFAGFLYAIDGHGFDYSFAADGTRPYHDGRTWGPDEYVWSPTLERLYFNCPGCSPDDIHWLSADPVSGEVGASEGDSPYHGSIDVEDPIRVEPNGDRALDGTGKLWDAYSLEIIGALAEPLADAHWGADHLMILRDDGNGGTRVEQRDSATLADWGSETLSGAPLRVLHGSDFFVVLTHQAGSVVLQRYVPPNDADGDGVANLDDAFSVDPAASVDTDRDASPDAWNPGYGPGDSTTGLELDAFPLDYACQRAEHGVGGVCDFALVVPPDPGAPLCPSDDPGAAAPSGSIALGAAVDLVALCHGWFAYGDADNDRLVVQHAFSGRQGLVVRLPRTPVDLLLDPDTKQIYVAMHDWTALAEIDLVTGAIQEHAVPDRAWRLHRDLGSRLIVVVETGNSSFNRDHYRLDLTTGALEGPVRESYPDAVWNPQRQELIAQNSSRLERYAIDFTGTSTFLEEAEWGWHGTSVALSADATQLAYGTYHLDGDSIAHYSSENLQTVVGVWPDADYPTGMAFDTTGAMLAVSSDVRLQVFDVESHERLRTFTVPSCPDGQLGDVGFSRGGALAFVKQECGPSAESVQFHWFRVD